jgi:leucyl aminopeptidase
LPIDIRLTAVEPAGDPPLAAYLAAGDGGSLPVGDDIVVPVQGAEQSGLGAHLDVPVGELISICEVTGKAGDLAQVVTVLDGRPRRILFLGLGDGSPAELRKAGEALARRAAGGRRLVTAAACGMAGESVRAFAEGLLLGSYRFSLASRAQRPDGRAEVALLMSGADGGPAALEQAIIVAEAVSLTRDLSNMPSARKSPGWLAEQAVRVAAGAGLSARVWGPGELAEGGFGGVIAVGAGSAEPPRLIELGYLPSRWDRHVVLVGKGITFDSGGLSLKPSNGMKQMKTDMAGGAVVIAVMSALARLAPGVRVTGLVPAAENMPSGSAMRPGDVITHFGGRTTEVLSTDAEGRLVLADAIAYAAAILAPDAIVDIATLTGAARVALGTTVGALYATDDDLAQSLLDASAASGDTLWRMPLADEYAGELASPVADSANVPHGPGSRAGSIEAALFLREFTGGLPWAHLDIAGTARAAADSGGATGFGTRALLRWLCGV